MFEENNNDLVERTLCQLPFVHVFRIPVRKTADGHRASDWPTDPTWTGKCKIVSKGRTCSIILLDNENKTFAICHASEEGAVERTLDSGRYFALRITNPQGRHAFIGIAFNERNDAFDFNVALSEFKGELDREDQAEKMSHAPVGPIKDLSLKDGEKIKIKIGLKKKTTDDQNSSMNFPLPTTTTFPKQSTINQNKINHSTNHTSSSNNISNTNDPFGSSDPFGSDPFATTTSSSSSSSSSTINKSDNNDNVFNFDSFSDAFPTTTTTSSNASKQQQTASNNSINSDPFGDFNNFTTTSSSSNNNKTVNLLDF